MSDPAPERITVSFNLTADEYSHYAAAVERVSKTWTAFYIFVAMGFGAIPIALLFRWLAAQRMNDPEITEMAGEYSLYAYSIAIIVTWIGTSFHAWIVRRRHFRTEVVAPKPRTTELDNAGVTVSSDGARVTYDWAVVTRLTIKQNLALLWVAPSMAVVIPMRCFGDEAASTAALTFVRARIAEAKAKLAQAASNAPKPDTDPA
jgi:hypothetical protein